MGVGTSSPASRLHVGEGGEFRLDAAGPQGSRDFKFRVTSRLSPSYEDLIIYSEDASGSESFTPRMTIQSAGNVGIGTTEPSAKLDVAGKIISQGNAVPRCNSGLVTLDANGDSEWIDSGFGEVPIFVYGEDRLYGNGLWNTPGYVIGNNYYRDTDADTFFGGGGHDPVESLSFYFVELGAAGKFRLHSRGWNLENKTVRWWAFTIF